MVRATTDGMKDSFTWHVDALGLHEAKVDLGGQRTVTLILYLTDLQRNEGGAQPCFEIWVVAVVNPFACNHERDPPCSSFLRLVAYPLHPCTLALFDV
jgi:hypothetical protein